MGWQWHKPYPGHGPWSNLPPWEGPGWVLRGWGRGWCWWLWKQAYLPMPSPWLSREDEIRYLEELKKYLTEVVLKEIDKRLEELKTGR